MTTKISANAGGAGMLNHNDTVASGLRVRTAVKAGKVSMQDFHFHM